MKPNIVIIMTDQQQARCCRREGFALDTTPFLDALACKGTWFDKAYTACPVCGPARVSMLTGRHTEATGVRSNALVDGRSWGKRLIGPRYETDLLDVLKAEGYATAMVGKNHSHWKRDDLDHWYDMGHSAGHGLPEAQRTEREIRFDRWLAELRHGVSDTPTPFPLACQGPYRTVTDAGNWISRVKGERPFFMWLSFAEPHNPYQVPEPYFSMFPHDRLPPVLADAGAVEAKGFKWQFLSRLERRSLPRFEELLPYHRSNYYGMLRLIDDQVRRFVGVLESEGLLDETIIFFVSDHGDFVGDYGLMRKGPEMPEDLMRIPFFVTGPGIRADSRPHPAFVSLIDVMPTICEAIAAPIPAGVQGRSLWPLLTGGDYPAEEFASVYAEHGFGGLDYDWDDEPDFDKFGPQGRWAIHFDELNQYTQCGIRRMLRRDNWKLIYDMNGRGQLYDLDKDPAELDNLFDDPRCADVRHMMVEELLAATLRAADPLPLPGGDYQRKNPPRNYWTQT